MDAFSVEINGQKLDFVKSVVIAAMEKNPTIDVVGMSSRLIEIASISCMASFTGTIPEIRVPGEAIKWFDDTQAATESVQIVAPYPESAMGGDSYDPMEATKLLPEFAKLPFEFGDKHSVIRSGEQTVIMNSAHYADLLSLREMAGRAIGDERVMRGVAEASAKFIADVSSIMLQGTFVLANYGDEFQASISPKDGGDYQVATSERIVTAVSQLAEIVANLQPVANEEPRNEPAPQMADDQPF